MSERRVMSTGPIQTCTGRKNVAAMNEFVWTFAVASVALIAGYMMCAMLSLDTRQKNERAVRRVRGLHHFEVDEIETREGPEDVQHCAECGYIPTDEEPCPTIRILDGAA